MCCARNDECPSGECRDGVCKIIHKPVEHVPGKTLLKSIKLNIRDCVGCSKEEEGVYLTLFGEQLVNFPQGYPCKTNELDTPRLQDFGSNTTPVFTNTEAREMLGQCYKVSLCNIKYIAVYYISIFPTSFH